MNQGFYFWALAVAAGSLMVGAAHAGDAIIGDSIACGVASHLPAKHFCRAGAGSCEIAGWAPHTGAYRRVVISAGINDSGACVAALRARITAREVVWILPAPINPGRAAVEAAMRPGDRAVNYDCSRGCTKTNFHPGSYSRLTRDIEKVW